MPLEETGRKSQTRLLTGQHNDLELLYSVLTDLRVLPFSVRRKRWAVLAGKAREKQHSLTPPGTSAKEERACQKASCSTGLPP